MLDDIFFPEEKVNDPNALKYELPVYEHDHQIPSYNFSVSESGVTWFES